MKIPPSQVAMLINIVSLNKFAQIRNYRDSAETPEVNG
jgi:hypothetical protein